MRIANFETVLKSFAPTNFVIKNGAGNKALQILNGLPNETTGMLKRTCHQYSTQQRFEIRTNGL